MLADTSQSFIIRGGSLIDGERCLQNCSVVVRSAKIDAVEERSAPGELPVFDFPDCVVTPGWIDLQLNGCGGVNFNDSITGQTLALMHETNLKSGTTGFLPTLITASEEAMRAALQVVADYRRDGGGGVQGVHLEGPYINPARKGIHDERNIRRPSPEMIETLLDFAPKFPLLLTLAPEMVDHRIIGRLIEGGVLVSFGHSAATYEEAMAGFTHGVRLATHLFNAMSPWTGRDPGMVGAVLGSPKVACGLIVDGIHVHDASIALAKKLKEQMCFLVTDAVAPVGTSLERFTFGGKTVYVRDDKCVSPDGTLGGSLLTLNAAIRNCVRRVGLTLLEAVRMATLYPARALGLERCLGKVQPGYEASLAIFDSGFRVRAVVDRGKLHLNPVASPHELEPHA